MKLKQRTHTHRDDISVTRHNKSILFHLSLFFISVSSTLSLSYSRQSSRSAHGRQATEFNGEGVLAEVAFVYMLQMWEDFGGGRKCVSVIARVVQQKVLSFCLSPRFRLSNHKDGSLFQLYTFRRVFSFPFKTVAPF